MIAMTLLVDRDDEGRTVLKSPGVGLWRERPAIGQLARAGESFGTIEVLGRMHSLRVPAGVHGVVLSSPIPEASAQSGLAYGQVVAVLGEDSGSSALIAEAASEGSDQGALVFRSSSSGRFYLRPAPDKPAFIAVGDEIKEGHIIYLLEVMKTFSRVAFEGEGLPDRAKVLRIIPNDGDDLEAGQVVLELEAL